MAQLSRGNDRRIQALRSYSRALFPPYTELLIEKFPRNRNLSQTPLCPVRGWRISPPFQRNLSYCGDVSSLLTLPGSAAMTCCSTCIGGLSDPAFHIE